MNDSPADLGDDDSLRAYGNLDPDTLLNAVEALGYRCDGRVLALNSYENRVYQIGVEDAAPVIAKFYRPGRWSDAAILEEHAFAQELIAADIPLVAPLEHCGHTLHRYGRFRFALFPRRGGHAPELDRPSHLRQLGRLIGRMHNVGSVCLFEHRPTLSVEEFGRAACDYVLEHDFIPTPLIPAYRSLTNDLVTMIEYALQSVDPTTLRLHGDCHVGNILWREEQAHIVDLDDARNGPAIQDLWMFLSGDHTYMSARLGELLEGYTAFRTFDARELRLIEPLRTLRLLNYSAWIARRWDDPAFPAAFPWFADARYWESQILSLKEQASLMTEPAPVWIT